METLDKRTVELLNEKWEEDKVDCIKNLIEMCRHANKAFLEESFWDVSGWSILEKALEDNVIDFHLYFQIRHLLYYHELKYTVNGK
jgi:hypothetical protein